MHIKRIEPSQTRIHLTSVPRLGKRSRVLLGSYVDAGIRNGESRGLSSAWRNQEPVKPGAILLKEIEETNSWARLAFQLYFGWFALQFTVNGIAIGWLFTFNGPLPSFASLIFLVFIGWNVMGLVVTILVYKALLDFDSRVKEVIRTMAKLDPTSHEPWSKARFAVPRSTIGIVLGCCGLTVLISLAFWLVLYVT
jgi:hypothetical protein